MVGLLIKLDISQSKKIEMKSMAKTESIRYFNTHNKFDSTLEKAMTFLLSDCQVLVKNGLPSL